MLHRYVNEDPAVAANQDTNSQHLVQSRFGVIKLNFSKAISFPQGLLGIPQKTLYGIADFPNEKITRYKILQSLEDIDLSLVLYPITEDNMACLPIQYRDEDLQQCARDLGIDTTNMVILLVAYVDQQSDPQRVQVNMRAPLVVDAEQLVGAQYVFNHNLYPLQCSL